MGLQLGALQNAGVPENKIYRDQDSGKRVNRPNLEACLKSLREGVVHVVWKLNRLARNLRHLVNTVQDVFDRSIRFKVLAGKGAEMIRPQPVASWYFAFCRLSGI